jgi:hypothetical protein
MRYEVKEYRSSLQYNAMAEKQYWHNRVFRSRYYLLVILIVIALRSLLLQFILHAEKRKLTGHKLEDRF